MKINDHIENILDRIAIPNLTLMLTAGSAIVYAFAYVNPGLEGRFVLIPEMVAQGEFWRLLAFPFYPMSNSLLFAVFAYYLFYMMGTALEAQWGTARFTHYILVGYAATIAAAFMFPYNIATNMYITQSVFLAFAYLYPDFELCLFFILPVKVKYLAAITWIFFGYTIIFEPVSAKLLAIVSVLNFLLFFGRSIAWTMRERRGQMENDFQTITVPAKPFHLCAVCGMTEKTNPDMDFRVCLECKGQHEYCQAHLGNHQHKN